jgi:hypothetical protein
VSMQMQESQQWNENLAAGVHTISQFAELQC